MEVVKVNNLFSEKDINSMVKNIKPKLEDNPGFSITEDLGRHQFSIIGFNTSVRTKLIEIANSVADFNCKFSSATYTEYNPKYGHPRLPTHFDGDWNDLIINYQLESNTSWSIGVDFNLYDLENNSAVIFNPNKNVHWRPRKLFKDGEFVRMIFFRFHNSESISDYSELRNHSYDNDIFKKVNEFRDSVSDPESPGDWINGQ